MGFGFGQRRGGQLPVELTGFVGRSSELAHVRTALEQSRLVTLTGPGGVGKSRTALRAVQGLRDAYPDGIWLAELSALRDPELIPATVAAVLQLPEQSGSDPLDAVVAHLQGRRLLILLDTCEHLVDGCAMLTDILLREAPDVRVLATSRQPLDVPGEFCCRIPPLADDDAVELFVQRAGEAAPGFGVTDDNREQIGTLVRRLDGIPLALELAAVRLRAVPLEQLMSRLDHRFEVLTGGRRTALTRHQTLRTAIGWSHELCTPQERLLWARLSAFAGEFDPQTAESVCADEELRAPEMLGHLIGLVDKSVVRRVDETGDRYRLLDTIREFGAEWLGQSGGTDAVRERHLAHHRSLVQRYRDTYASSAQLGLHRALRAGHADLRAAFEYAYANPEHAADGLYMAANLSMYWRSAGMLTEGLYWLEKGLVLVPQECTERVWGLFVSGLAVSRAGDSVLGHARFRQALEMALRLGETRIVDFAGVALGGVATLGGDPAGPAAMAAARERLRDADDLIGYGGACYEGGLALAVVGDTATALKWCEEGLAVIGRAGEWQLRGTLLCVQGLVRWVAGQRGDAVAEPLRRALDLAGEIENILVAAACCLGLSWVAADADRPVRAAWLLGYADHARVGGEPFAMLPPLLKVPTAQTRKSLAATLGEAEFARWYARGARLTGTRILRAVRADADVPPEPDAAPDAAAPVTHDVLTRREREVAALVAQGLTNREIADRLVISKRTADAHVEHILAKLGVSSRREITAAAPDP
ncbi:ATP-binding protein [Streptomyces longispororuber]|uniref:ATP-binding protein n=1 Tax=Streptomyces longispororuber TaxID=68230 RepID=UPI00210B0DF1|nr:LuxR C-terminal-related transcriptional regulator [Streptomyces longispororuber]MCQ4214420.1 LuxR C-terminal-related transcriptional regulator [Streptomyces longispororuber]